MKLGRIYRAFKYFTLGFICLAIAGFIFTTLQEIRQDYNIEASLNSIPNYNYIQDIKILKAEGKLSEAIELARYVIRNADMPGQDNARRLEKELEAELTSLWGRTKRITNGFVTGSGNSIEELSGGIASDMLLWGDIRDLVKQGYYKITGKETDPVLVALAGIGLLTEVVDVADWAPAVLKAFRKIGALTQRFADFVISACKKSVKTRKLDGALKASFKELRTLSDKMGTARTAAVFKHINHPSDLTAITKVAQKNSDAAYFTVKNGGEDGVTIIKLLGNTDVGVTSMAKAAKKGPASIQWLKRGGAGHKYVVRMRFGTRLLKNLQLQRPQKLIIEIAKRYSGIIYILWAITAMAALAAIFAFIKSGRQLFSMKSL